jgi:uncharacterized membrane protein YqaE (UPF0057 family)
MNKPIRSLLLFPLIALFAFSCKTNTNLNSDALIQKRRYTKGFHLNLKKASKDLNRSNQERLIPLQAKAMASTQPLPLKKKLHRKRPLATNVTQRATELPESSPEEVLSSEKNPRRGFKEVFSKPDLPTRKFVPTSPPAAPASKLLVIIITILLPPLGVALVFGLAVQFWLSLLLTLLFYVPGLIYSLIVVLAEY